MSPRGDSTTRVLGVGEPQSVETAAALEGEGFAVETTAPDEVTARLDGVDCLVCGPRGVALIESIREDRPDLPVFVLVEDLEAAERALDAGATDCLPRPDPGDVSLLADRIERFVDRETPIEERFRLVTEHVEEAIFITRGIVSTEIYDDPPADAGIEYISPGFEDIWGRPVEAAYDDPGVITEGIHPEDREEYRAHLEQMAADAGRGDPAERYTFDCRVRRPDGEVRWIATTTVPVPVEGADAYRWIGTIRDITERKERERTYQEVFENVTDGLVVHDIETGEIVDVNERFCAMNGYDREELVGSDIGLVTAGDEAYSYEAAKERIEAAAEEGPQLFEWRNRRKGGEEFPVEVHLSVARIDGEDRVLASVRDITERKERERELRETEERFRLVTEHVEEAIFITRGIVSMADVYDDPPPEREVEYFSPAFEDLYGVPVEEVQEDPSVIRDAIHPEDRGEYRSMLESMVADADAGDVEDAYSVEYRVRDGDERWMRTTAYPALTESGEAYRWVGIIEDITERRERERLIRDLHGATERVQEAETVEAVCEAAVAAARDVLDLPMTACWVHDESAESLDPVAGAEPVRERDLLDSGFAPGDPEYEAFREGEATVYDPSAHNPGSPLDAAILLPLGEHGLLAAGNPDAAEYPDHLIEAGEVLARHVATALDRAHRAEALRKSERRFRMIAERVDQIIYLANADLSEVLYVNPAYETVYGRPVEELYEDARAFAEGILLEDREGYEASLERMLADIEAGDVQDSYDFAYRVRRPDGEVRHVEATGYPVRDDSGEVYRFVGIADDVTREARREAAVETLGESVRELIDAETREEACEIAVRAAGEVLDDPAMTIHLHDESEGVLRPVARTDAAGEHLPDPPTYDGSGSLAWRAFVGGEDAYYEDVNERDDLGRALGSVLYLPLGPHGVVTLGSHEADAFEEEELELARVLAASTEVALNWAREQRTLERHERQLEEQAERIERLDRLNTVIRDIEQATVEASTRDEIEAAICSRLADVESYRLVWIGEPDAAGEAITLRNRAGEDRRDGLDVALGNGGGAEAHPALDAVETGELQVVGSIVGSAPESEWRKRALSRGYQSCCAVPLSYDGVVHGVLTVYSDRPGTFDERERSVLEEVGRSIGYAITALERKRALESDTTTELEFRAWDDDLAILEVASRASCSVELERAMRRPEGTVSAFYTVEGVDPAAGVEAVESAPRVREARAVNEGDDGGLIEVRTGSWFGGVFAEHGAAVREATADGEEGEGRIVVELPREADTRRLVETFRHEYPGTELAAKRERPRADRTPLELQAALEDRLTDRQLEAVETAYSAGYFEWPRESSGEAVADLLDITQPTFNKHLRAAERKAFSLLLSE